MSQTLRMHPTRNTGIRSDLDNGQEQSKSYRRTVTHNIGAVLPLYALFFRLPSRLPAPLGPAPPGVLAPGAPATPSPTGSEASESEVSNSEYSIKSCSPKRFTCFRRRGSSTINSFLFCSSKCTSAWRGGGNIHEIFGDGSQKEIF